MIMWMSRKWIFLNQWIILMCFQCIDLIFMCEWIKTDWRSKFKWVHNCRIEYGLPISQMCAFDWLMLTWLLLSATRLPGLRLVCNYSSSSSLLLEESRTLVRLFLKSLSKLALIPYWILGFIYVVVVSAEVERSKSFTSTSIERGYMLRRSIFVTNGFEVVSVQRTEAEVSLPCRLREVVWCDTRFLPKNDVEVPFFNAFLTRSWNWIPTSQLKLKPNSNIATRMKDAEAKTNAEMPFPLP